MATALNALEKLQMGIETTAGTLVAADTVIVADSGGTFTPEIDRQAITDVHGVLAEVDDLDVRKGSLLSVTHSLDYEQVLIPLVTGLKGVTTPTGVGPYTWTVTPAVSAPEALSAATFEVSFTDGTTRHLEREFGYGTCSHMAISSTFNAPATITADYFGRAPQTSTFTGALTELSRELIPGSSFGVYIDGTWAGLGTTQKSGLVRSFTLDLLTGAAPKYTLDARSDLDMGGLTRGMVTGTLELVMEYSADGDAEYDAWESKTRRFISLEATGSGTRSLKLQGCFEYTTPPAFSVEEGLRLVTLTGALRYDPTSTNVVSAEVVNDLSGI